MVNGFCVDCYVSDHPELLSVPKQLKLEYCPQCFRIFVGGEWVPGHDDLFDKFIRSKIKTKLENPVITVNFVSENEKSREYAVVVEGVLGGEQVQLQRGVLVRMLKKQCGVCGRKDSTYFEALVQLRSKAHNSNLEILNNAFIFLRNQNQALIKFHREAEVFSYERVKSGINVYFGSAKAAKKALQYLAHIYNCDIKESHKLVGIDKPTGKRRYKTTYSVRL
jgi:NMD protein affecting ribosome stability and mRNA decay